MAVRERYTLMTPLDRTWLDHELPISMAGAKKIIPTRVIMFYLVMGMIILYMLSSTFVRDAGPIFIVLAIIWMLTFTMFFGRYTATKEMPFVQVLSFIDYAPKRARAVMTRYTSNPRGFYGLVGIEDVEEDGLIRYANDRLGRVYRVAGSASKNIFNEDSALIRNRVDGFWRSWPTTAQVHYITTKEPQRVDRQLVSLQERAQNLKYYDPDLEVTMNEQKEVLQKWVGEEFISIQQYMVVTAAHAEHLQRAVEVLRNEIQDSSLMIKSPTQLTRTGVLDMLSAIYRPT